MKFIDNFVVRLSGWTLSTVRNKSTAPDVLGVPKKVKTPDETEKKRFNIPQNYRYTYPEFLPDPHLWFRNPVREQIERQDMIDRRYVKLKEIEFSFATK